MKAEGHEFFIHHSREGVRFAGDGQPGPPESWGHTAPFKRIDYITCSPDRTTIAYLATPLDGHGQVVVYNGQVSPVIPTIGCPQWVGGRTFICLGRRLPGKPASDTKQFYWPCKGANHTGTTLLRTVDPSNAQWCIIRDAQPGHWGPPFAQWDFGPNCGLISDTTGTHIAVLREAENEPGTVLEVDDDPVAYFSETPRDNRGGTPRRQYKLPSNEGATPDIPRYDAAPACYYFDAQTGEIIYLARATGTMNCWYRGWQAAPVTTPTPPASSPIWSGY